MPLEWCFGGFVLGERTKRDNLGGIDRGPSRTSIRGKRQIPLKRGNYCASRVLGGDKCIEFLEVP